MANSAGTDSLLLLLQLSDSALPIGAYTHSFALETWVKNGLLNNSSAVAEALEALVQTSIGPQEGSAASVAHILAANQDRQGFATLNQYLSASRWTDEILKASTSMGSRLRQLAEETEFYEYEIDYAGAAQSTAAFRPAPVPAGQVHHCAVFGWLAGSRQIAREQAVAAYLFSSMFSLVSAAIRLVPLGHTDGQRILSRLRRTISGNLESYLATEITSIHSFAPLNEWASIEHQGLYSRLFQS